VIKILKNTKVHLVGFLNNISKFKFELAQYYRLKGMSMQKMENFTGEWLTPPPKKKILSRSYGRKSPDRINNPIVFSWDN
jgi:hypothetical protein